MTAAIPRLPDCDVAIYLLDRRAALSDRFRERAFLTDAEIARRDRFRQEADRDRFALGRALLRAALGRALAREARSIAFAFERFGRPVLAEGPATGFSLSHSGPHVAVAVSALGPDIGLDVEAFERPIDIAELAGTVLSSEERADLAELPHGERALCFQTLWTLKEARLKASGVGLQVEPSECVIDGDAPHTLRRFAGEPADELAQWRMRHWRLADGAHLASAVRAARTPTIRIVPVETLL